MTARPRTPSARHVETLVVDASVAVKWFVPETGTDQALQLLSGKYRLIAPDLLWIEVASVFWKLARRGLLSGPEAEQLTADLLRMPVELAGSLPLLPAAMQIGRRTDRTLYDSLYVALAVGENATLITADDRLANALAGDAVASRVRRLSDVLAAE